MDMYVRERVCFVYENNTADRYVFAFYVVDAN